MLALLQLDYSRIYRTRSPLLLSLYSRGLLAAPEHLLESRVRLGKEESPGCLVLYGKELVEFALTLRYSIIEGHRQVVDLHKKFEEAWKTTDTNCRVVEQAIKSGQPDTQAISKMYKSGILLFALDFLGKHAFPLDHLEEILTRLQLSLSNSKILHALSIPNVMPHYLKYQQEYDLLHEVTASQGLDSSKIEEFIHCHAYLETYDIRASPSENYQVLLNRLNKGPPAKEKVDWSVYHSHSLAIREGILTYLLLSYRDRWGWKGLRGFFDLLSLFLDIVNHEELKRYLQTRIARNLRVIAQKSGLDPKKCSIEDIQSACGTHRQGRGDGRGVKRGVPITPLKRSSRRTGSIPSLPSDFIPLDSPKCMNRSLVGNKALVLSQLRREGFQVPPGFVIPTSCLNPLSSSLANRAFKEKVIEAVGTLGDPLVAVRSSFVGEDELSCSFAGGGKSFLGLSKIADIIRALSVVRREWLKETGNSRSPTSEDGGILVQKQIDASVSGVLTESVYGKKQTFIVESTAGLNVGVTKGNAHSLDRHLISKSGEILDGSSSVKVVAHIVCVGRNKSWRLGKSRILTINRRRRNLRIIAIEEGDGISIGVFSKPFEETCLTSDQLRNLANLAVGVKRIYKHSLDMEWAIDTSGKIWILQLRPLTRPVVYNKSRNDEESRTPLFLAEGVGASSGIAAGYPRIWWRGHSSSVRDNEIIIADQILATHMRAISRVRGIVTEQGGILSHTAIVAREMGIPCVVGVADARKLLAEERLIQIDGSSGKISRVLLFPQDSKEIVGSMEIDTAGRDILLRASRKLDFVLPNRYSGLILELLENTDLCDPHLLSEMCRSIQPRPLYILDRSGGSFDEARGINFSDANIHLLSKKLQNDLFVDMYWSCRKLFFGCDLCISQERLDRDECKAEFHRIQECYGSITVLCGNPTLIPGNSFCPAPFSNELAIFEINEANR